jgi:putative endonuclease
LKHGPPASRRHAPEPAGGTPAVHNAFVYVLGSASGDKRVTYVGWCVDLDARLTAHNTGRGARSTRGRAWVLLYAERYQNRREAMSREVFLKRDRPFRAALAKLM